MSVEPLRRTVPEPPPDSPSSASDGLIGAWHRAMPFTRLVDCGMDHADARELLERTGAGQQWDGVATAIGERQSWRSSEAQSDGRTQTALEAARYAVAAFSFAQMAHNTDSVDKRARYHRFFESVEHLVALLPGVLEPVSVPFAGGHLCGWLRLPDGDRAPSGTVLLWGGLSGWGATYLPIAEAYAKRGLATLMAEGPGQGRPRIEDGIHLTPQTLEGFGVFVDYVLADPRLCGPVGLQGNSFGGLFAARLAASDERVSAWVVNGAPAVPTLPDFRNAREQMLAVFGTEDPDEVQHILDLLRFDPASQTVSAPLLVLQGGADPLATEADQRPFLEAATHPGARLRSWPDGEHTLYNHAAERNALVGDWFAEQFATSSGGHPAGAVDPTPLDASDEMIER